MKSHDSEIPVNTKAGSYAAGVLLAARPESADDKWDDCKLAERNDITAESSEPVAPRTSMERDSTSGAVSASGKVTRKQVGIALSLAGLLSIGGAAAFFFPQFFGLKSNKAPAAATPVVTVSVEPARKILLNDMFSVTGAIAAQDPLAIPAEVNGLRIVSVNVEEGDYVKRGQVLATLNSAVLRAQLEQAQARLDASKAGLRKAEQPQRAEDISALKAAYAEALANISQSQAVAREAKANKLNAQENAKRYAQLARQGAVSRQDAETRITASQTTGEVVLSTEAKVSAARFTAEQAHERLQLALHGGRTEDVQISQAALREIKGNIAQLQAMIDQTIIRAPEDGLITKRDAHVGDVSTTGKPLFYQIRNNQLELQAHVSDIDLGKFAVGQPVTIKPTENDTRSATGTVWLVSPQVDPTTRLGTIRIALTPTTWLKPGMFVEGQVILGRREMLTVPLPAIVTHNGDIAVFTISEGKAQSCSITTGIRTDTLAEVTSGLTAGQQVIVKGAGFAGDGDVVRVAR